MRIAALVLGVLCVLLGGLWLIQGLGLVTIAPVLCVAECKPLTGPSALWAALGFAMVLLGAAGIFYGRPGR